MKGVNKCVVEIVEPQDESIERVLVFLSRKAARCSWGASRMRRKNMFPAWFRGGAVFCRWDRARALRCGQRLPRPPLCCCGSFCKRAAVRLRRKCPKSGGNYSKDAVSVL